MKKLLLFCSILIASLAFSVAISAATGGPETIDVSKYVVKWSDEFNGTELDRNTWTPQIGNGNQYGIWEWGNNEKQYYKVDNITVNNGSLHIKADNGTNKVNDTTYNYTSGRMVSDGALNLGGKIGLGYVEASIKIPNIKGIWPAFWMLGNNGKTWPECGEIDIMESFNTAIFQQATIHWPDASGNVKRENRKTTQNGTYDKTQWHTYGLWRDGKNISVYLDREWFGNFVIDDSKGNMSVLNDDYHILFNIACGGNLAGGTPDKNQLPVVMDVDYVRWYVDAPPTTTPKPTTTTAVKKPGRAVIKSLKNQKKRKLKVTLKKMAKVKGYQVRWCDSKSFEGYEDKGTTKTKVIIKHLDKRTKYYVKARAYRKKANGTKLYGRWSKVKKKRVKK